MSGHGKRQTDQRALTSWRRQRKALVRTQKEIDRPTRTHQLWMGEGGTCQDTKRNRPTDAHSPTGDSRGMHLSGHGNKQTDRCALTSWRQQREALVRIQKDTDRPTRTHILETAEGCTCQDTERNRPTDAHSPTGDGRGRHLSGHRKRQADRRALTSWRWQREVLVRTRKETDRPKHTHPLETEEGGTCQDTERYRPTDAHSLSGDGRGRHLSGHGQKQTDRRALTSW